MPPIRNHSILVGVVIITIIIIIVGIDWYSECYADRHDKMCCGICQTATEQFDGRKSDVYVLHRISTQRHVHNNNNKVELILFSFLFFFSMAGDCII